MAALDNIASELLKSANEADLIYKRTRDQAQRDKAVRLRRIVENLKAISAGGLTPTLDEVLTEGNVSTNTLNVGGITSDYFQLDTTATPTLAPGMFAWNDAFGTADLRLKGNNVTLQVGQETLARVVNKTGADLLESQYKVVRVRIASEGGAQGQRLAVVLAQGNNDPDSATTLGIVTEDIPNNQEGFITIFGNVNNINTTGSLQGETWVDGDVLYLSPTTPGSLTKVKPTAPQHTLIVGYVVYAHNNQGKIFVKVDNGYELDELHNVLITSPANNDLLQYDSAQQVWKNVASSVAVPTPTLAQVTTAGNTTTNSASISGFALGVVGAVGNTNYITKDIATTIALANSSTAGGVSLWAGTNASPISRVMAMGNGDIWMLPTTGVFIGTTTNAGYKLDVNGIARVVTRIDAGSFSPGAGASAYTFATTGRITAAGGYNLRSPITGDSTFSGLGDNSGPTIYNNNTTVVRFATVGGTLNGTNVDILQGYNPGAGTGTVVGFKHSYNLYPSADNTVSYTSFLSNPSWNSAPFYNRITGPIRGFYFVNGLYNTQKLVDVIAFESNGGRVVFAGEAPSASGGISRGVYVNQTLTAAANNDVLVGLDIAPTFTNGAFTGVTNYALRVSGTISQFTSPGATQIRIEGPSGANKSVFFFNTSSTFANTRIYNTGTTNQFIIATGDATIAPTDRFTIFQTGNVAINSTTDAGYKLDINGTARIKTDLKIETNTGGLTIEGDASGYPTLSINTLRSGVDRRNWKFATEQINVGDFVFYRSSTGGGAANTVVYAISKDGNFGLGTTTPTDKFHIVDNTNGNKFGRISAGGTDASAAWVAQNDQVDNIVYRVFGSAVTGSQMGQALARSASLIANLGGTGKFLIGSFSSTDLIFGTSDQARMRLVDSTGNFLIGTMTDTGNKLTVSGNIDAQGYKVNNVLGYTGILNIPTNPPGQQNIDIQGGIVINIF